MSTLAIEFILPILTALIAWFANAYRNKQKKEHDILDNVQQIIDMQNKHIERCDAQIAKRDELLQKREAEYHKLEGKYEHKVKAVKEAYDCRHDTNLCPVLIYDKKHHICDTCELKNPKCANDTEQDTD